MSQYWQSAGNEGDVVWDEGEAGDYVNELFTDSAQRYLSEIEKVMGEKTIFVCSNREDEYDFCKKNINILAYK